MKTYRIQSIASGKTLGTFAADTCAEAIEAMRAAEDWDSSLDCAEADGTSVEAVNADFLAVCVDW